MVSKQLAMTSAVIRLLNRLNPVTFSGIGISPWFILTPSGSTLGC